MATTQQAIDTKYDYYLALRDEKLKALFSSAILGWARQNGLNTFEAMTNYAGAISLIGENLSTIKGVDFLLGLTQIDFSYNKLTDVGDLSGLSALEVIHLQNNQLTDIGNVSGLKSLTELNVYNNQLTDIGILSELTALTYLNVYNNQLTVVGDLSEHTALTYLNLGANNLETAQVDAALANMHTAYDLSGKIATIDLHGTYMAIPTGGVNNADYVYLTNAGVSVTIRTA